MAVWFYSTEPTEGSVAIAVEHSKGCSVGRPGWPDRSMTEPGSGCSEGCRTGYRTTSYAGLVVGTWERNGYDDSDFYAEVVTDRETGATESIQYATTRGWTYLNGAEVDAPEPLKRLVADRKARAAARERERIAAEKRDLDARTPGKGATVRCISKRSKVPHGTEGVVFWFGKSGYARPNYYGGNPAFRAPNSDHPAHSLGDYRVGFKSPDGARHFCSATCVEVVKGAE